MEVEEKREKSALLETSEAVKAALAAPPPPAPHPALFRSSTTTVLSSMSSTPSPFSATAPMSMFSSSSSLSSSPLIASLGAAGKKRKVGFGLGLAALEKQKQPTVEESRAEERTAEAEKKETEAAVQSIASIQPQLQPAAVPSLLRSVTAPDLGHPPPTQSPSGSHRQLSVAIPSPSPLPSPSTMRTGSLTSPQAAAALHSPPPSSPLQLPGTATPALVEAATPLAATSPYTSPFPQPPARCSSSTPPSLSSSLSPSPPSSPTSPSVRLSDLLDFEGSSSKPPLKSIELPDDDKGATAAAADEDGAEPTAAVIPPHLLHMSKQSLLAAIQKLDEQINDGEDERDHVLDQVKELRQKVNELQSRQQRASSARKGGEDDDMEDDGEEEEDEEERVRAEQDSKARLKEEEARRKEEQYAFEHFTLADSTDSALPLSSRIYQSNQRRAAHAHQHFQRLYPSEMMQAFRVAQAHASSSRPPPLERPSSFGLLSAVTDPSVRSALSLPLYSEPSECLLYRDNLARFPLFRQRVMAVLARRKRQTFGKIRKLAAQYLQSERRWLQLEEVREAKRRSQPPLPRLSRTTAHLLGEAGYGFEPYPVASPAPTAREAELKRAKWQKGLVSVPSMLLDSNELRHSAFLSRNGYIEDCKEEERQFKLSNPWTAREAAVFEAKYIKFPKQFRKISSYLPNKNVNDCVAYYYTSKLDTNYKELVRNQQKRSRMEKKGKRKGEEAEEELEEDEEDEGGEHLQPPPAAAATNAVPDAAGTGRMAVAAGKRKEKGSVSARVRGKPRGISRELIGLAIDLSTQGKIEGREKRRVADKVEGGDDGEGEGDGADSGEGETEDEGREEAADEEAEMEPAAAGEGEDGEVEDSAMADDGDEEQHVSSAVPTSALPTHLDLYDDDDDIKAGDIHQVDATSRPEKQRPPRQRSALASDGHDDDNGGAGDDDELDLQAAVTPAIMSTAIMPASAADKDEEEPSTSAASKSHKRRRLSKSAAISATVAVAAVSSTSAAAAASGDARPYWTDAERALFLSGLDEHGKSFSLIAAHVGTKSAEKCKNFWNNNKSKLRLDERLEARRTAAGGGGGAAHARAGDAHGAAQQAQPMDEDSKAVRPPALTSLGADEGVSERVIGDDDGGAVGERRPSLSSSQRSSDDDGEDDNDDDDSDGDGDTDQVHTPHTHTQQPHFSAMMI